MPHYIAVNIAKSDLGYIVVDDMIAAALDFIGIPIRKSEKHHHWATNGVYLYKSSNRDLWQTTPSLNNFVVMAISEAQKSSLESWMKDKNGVGIYLWSKSQWLKFPSIQSIRVDTGKKRYRYFWKLNNGDVEITRAIPITTYQDRAMDYRPADDVFKLSFYMGSDGKPTRKKPAALKAKTTRAKNQEKAEKTAKTSGKNPDLKKSDERKPAEKITIAQDRAWYWVSGDTKPHKEALKAAGGRWSSKRSAWYFTSKPAQEILDLAK